MLSVPEVESSSGQQHIVSDIADSFYTLFGPVFAMLVITGLYNAWVEVRSVGALLTTPYGWFLSVKLLVFAYLTSRSLRHASILMPDHDHKMDSKPLMDSNHEMSHHMEHGHGM